MPKEGTAGMSDEELTKFVEGLSDEDFEQVLGSLDEAQVNKVLDALGVEKAPERLEEDVEELEAMAVELEEQRDQATLLEQRLADAEARLADSEKRLALSDEMKRKAVIDAIMVKAEAYRDEGRAHSKILLDTARSLLLMEPIKTGDGDDAKVIKLEHEEDKEPTVAQVHQFYHKAIVYLLESLPGLVPTESGTHYEDASPLGGKDDEKEKVELEENVKDFLEHTGGRMPDDEED